MSATPILDRELPLPAALRVRGGGDVHLGVLVFLGVVVVMGLALSPLRRWFASMFGQLGDASPIVAFGWLLFITVAVVAIHELGHVAAGLAVGFRFHWIAIGPLRIDRSFRLSFVRGHWHGGWASMLPATRSSLRARTAVFVAAGPIACIAVALAALPFSHRWPAQFFVFASFLSGVSELMPLRTRTILFDGWRLWMLARNVAWCDRMMAVLALAHDLRSGVEPEQLAAEDIARATAFCDESADTVVAHAFAYSNAFHQRRNDDAARLLETCLRYAGFAMPPLHEALMCDAAVFQARRRARPDLAQQWLESIQNPGYRARAEAAILEVNSNFDGAIAKLAEVPPLNEVDSRMLDRWKSELASLQSSA